MDAAHELAATRLFLAQEDVDCIEGLARNLQMVHEERRIAVVDLGAGSGATALAVYCAAPRAMVSTIDRDGDALEWAGVNVRAYFASVDWLPVCADAAAAAALWEDRTVDLLLHDAGHECADVLHDPRAWYPKLRAGAPVWMHDAFKAGWSSEWYPGVTAAVCQLINEGTFEHDRFAGPGWVLRKPQ